jgi:hypothetical protein
MTIQYPFLSLRPYNAGQEIDWRWQKCFAKNWLGLSKH